MRALKPVRAIAIAALLAGCASAEQPALQVKGEEVPTGSFITYASGLKVSDTKVGSGAYPKKGQICVMHYTGWLYQNGRKGAKFDSSVDRGQPF